MDGSNDQVSADCERLIWECNPKSLYEQPTADRDTWAGSVQQELRQFGLDPKLSVPGKQRPYLKAAVVMMAKDEADVIGENLRWLYLIGLRRLVLLDNHSNDRTSDIANQFKNEFQDFEILIVNDPIIRYMQGEKTTGLYRMAISIWPDLRWVFPIDADEFLIPMRGLQVLDAIDERVDALTIPKVVHYQTRSKTNLSAGSFLQQMAYRSRPFVAPPKIAARHNLFIAILQGNHQVHLADHRPPVYAGALQHGLYYREYPTRSFEHLLRKVRNGGRAILAAEEHLGRSVGGYHWKAYYKTLLDEGERAILELYERDFIKSGGDDWVLDPFTACEGPAFRRRGADGNMPDGMLQLLPARDGGQGRRLPL